MPSTRRSYLAGAGLLASGVAGCADVLSGGESVDLVLSNYTAETQPIKVELLDEGGNTNGDALVLGREFEIPAPSGDETAGRVRETGVAPRDRYLVRVLPKWSDGRWRHHHFYPDASAGAADAIGIRLHRDAATGGLSVRFG